jgi:hypothetical protein
MTLKYLLLLSTGALGIFFGAQLTEAALIVPYWKELSPDAFFAFYNAYGKKLQQFYAPLTIAATILPIVTFVCYLFGKSKIDFFMWLMTITTILFFATYFLYFKEANLSFTDRTISNEALPQVLITWEKWHLGRVLCEAVAFASGLILLFKAK